VLEALAELRRAADGAAITVSICGRHRRCSARVTRWADRSWEPGKTTEDRPRVRVIGKAGSRVEADARGSRGLDLSRLGSLAVGAAGRGSYPGASYQSLPGSPAPCDRAQRAPQGYHWHRDRRILVDSEDPAG
jgi:hypothetical protein